MNESARIGKNRARLLSGISPRLAAIGEKVRPHVPLYDIGTDHAFLPAFLCLRGITEAAVAADVAEGPLSRALQTVTSLGLTDRITVTLSDGLSSLALAGPCDIVIAGMGGELIRNILAAKPEVKDPGIRLILQPMTKPEKLREYLARTGFAVTEEDLCEDGRIYQIIVCHYTSIPYRPADAELLVGVESARRKNPLFPRFLRQKLEALGTVTEGKRKAGMDCSAELSLQNTLNQLLSEEEP